MALVEQKDDILMENSADQGGKKVLTKEEIRKVLKACRLTKHEDRNRFIVHLSFLSGMRAIEIANLRGPRKHTYIEFPR